MRHLLALSTFAALIGCDGDKTSDPEPDETTPVDSADPDSDAPPDDTDDPPDDTGEDTGDSGGDSGDTAPPGPGPAVILLIGDGMGQAHVEAASRYATGSPDALAMHALPHRGTLRTASLSGITDSAAAATTMATGARTYNDVIAVDADGAEVETLVELAQRLGLGSGVVSTAALAHATPASFTAHDPSRRNYTAIADDQALIVRPDVMLGGGQRFVLGPKDLATSERDDDGLADDLVAAGCAVLLTDTELIALDPASTPCFAGFFADEHLDYVWDMPGVGQPSLAAMTEAALARLDTEEAGFFLMIEGARIDMASHANELERAIAETLAFDEAVAVALAFAEKRGNTTILVTADHECGGLELLSESPAGEMPAAAWRWRDHTNAPVDVFGYGEGSELFDGALLDHAWVHGALAARLQGAAVEDPPDEKIPDGSLADHRYRAAEQALTTDFGEGFNQLDALTLDADSRGLFLGIEGAFEWDNNAVALLVDVDYGAGSGLTALAGALADYDGQLDAILSAMPLGASSDPSFAADFAVVVWGGQDAWLEDLSPDAGLRGITPDSGAPGDLWWLPAAITFGEGVRTVGSPIIPASGEGLEVMLPWTALYASDFVPPGAEVGVVAVLVNSEGTLLSNQALPAFDDLTGDPRSLGAVAVLGIDGDGDGVGDGDGGLVK